MILFLNTSQANLCIQDVCWKTQSHVLRPLQPELYCWYLPARDWRYRCIQVWGEFLHWATCVWRMCPCPWCRSWWWHRWCECPPCPTPSPASNRQRWQDPDWLGWHTGWSSLGPCNTFIAKAVLAGHFSGHLLDVLLSLDVDARNAGQVDDGEIGSVVGVDTELDGIVYDLPAPTGHIVSQLFDVRPHLSEVGVLLPRSVVLEDCVGLPVRFSCMEGAVLGSVWTRRSSRGRRVTTPDPRGRKSRPTMFSRSELLPLDCVPRTAIRGREISLSRP